MIKMNDDVKSKDGGEGLIGKKMIRNLNLDNVVECLDWLRDCMFWMREVYGMCVEEWKMV